MGAVVGGLYAAGYTPDEMMALIKSEGFADWSTGKIDPDYLYYFDREPSSPAMVKVNLGSSGNGRPVSVLPTSLINPLPMNFAFMDLFAAYTAQCGGDFDLAVCASAHGHIRRLQQTQDSAVARIARRCRQSVNEFSAGVPSDRDRFRAGI